MYILHCSVRFVHIITCSSSGWQWWGLMNRWVSSYWTWIVLYYFLLARQMLTARGMDDRMDAINIEILYFRLTTFGAYSASGAKKSHLVIQASTFRRYNGRVQEKKTNEEVRSHCISHRLPIAYSECSTSAACCVFIVRQIARENSHPSGVLITSPIVVQTEHTRCAFCLCVTIVTTICHELITSKDRVEPSATWYTNMLWWSGTNRTPTQTTHSRSRTRFVNLNVLVYCQFLFVKWTTYTNKHT